MTLFLDTSALVKLYAEEKDSDRVRDSLHEAEIIACQWLAYVEARSAFSRKRSLGGLNTTQLERCKADLNRDWLTFHRIETTELLLLHAADLAERFVLRAYDSVHLAAAHSLQNAIGTSIAFGCFDRPLCAAAVELGLRIEYPDSLSGKHR